MNHYIDIVIKPDKEMRENVLLNKVYTKLHKALSEKKLTDVGVSFPRYKILLGNVIRIHGGEARLLELEAISWLGGLCGCCDVSTAQKVPEGTAYRTISRKQSNMTEAKLRRLIKRGSISPEAVKAYKAKMFEKGLENPYLELESASNRHKHRRYLQLGELRPMPVEGEFDQFGLSKTATIPWF